MSLDGDRIADCRNEENEGGAFDEANAALIVEAVNSYDALRALNAELAGVLERFVDVDGHIEACGNGGVYAEDCSPLCSRTVSALEAAHSAIAKARGTP